ncbi:MAG: glycosyltransferase [Bacteroidales bacterium]|nr:glycosyltransferase [Bacteroidales bacterium]
MTIGLCLLVYNELEGCKQALPLIRFDQFDEVFAVDGGSTDGTIEYLKSMGVEVRVQPKKGYNAAYIFAFESSGSDALIFFHPKGTIHPDQTLDFRSYFNTGFDLVIASRIIKGSQNEEDHQFFKFRKWFVVFLGLVAGVIWRREGVFIWDVLHGFRGITRKAFLEIEPIDHGLSMDLEMVVRSYKKNFKRVEFPVQESSRQSGETHFKPFPTAIRLFRYMLFELGRK